MFGLGKKPRKEYIQEIKELKIQNQILKNKLKNSINTKSVSEFLEYNLKLPYFQRPPDNNHIEELVEYYKNNINNWDFYQVIYLGKCINDNSIYILDGSHRISALKILQRQNLINNQKIKYILVKKNTIDELKTEFKLINSNMPLSKLYQSDNREILEEIVCFFMITYPKNFTPVYKKGLRRPIIVRINFENAITDYVDYYIEKNPDSLDKNPNNIANEIIQEIEKLDNIYSKFRKEQFPQKGSTDHSKILQRIKKSKSTNKKLLFLGMFSTGKWLMDLKNGVENKKIRLSKLKNDLWDFYIGADNARVRCLCCNDSEIKKTSYHCGHIFAKSKNGTTNVFNCLPICQECNTKMNNKCLFDYMREMKYDTNNPLLDLIKKIHYERDDLIRNLKR